MGSKGQSQTSQNQNQTSTYAPNPQTAGYITGAMDRATSAAGNPFAIPQAPVAGFSPDQMSAFQAYRDAQGAAQPYYDKAAGYFSPQGTQDFYNPYAANVMANMNDVFGQQQSQNTGKLVQAAGGVGADRIAVGEAELSKQQGLVAGQTMADLWQRAGAQAQSAGQGQMALGNAAQTSQLQGAGALYGAGQQQQALQQAQMNSPYQQQLAMAAFPYQQAQFLAGITGALAPGLGGTTYGNTTGAGTSQAPQPSIWSQLLGAGTAAAGIYGGFNGKSGGTGTGDGSWYGPSSVGGAPLSARGGRVYAEGGEVQEENPFGVSSQPIDISAQSYIPQVQLQAIKPTIPQLAPLQQPQQQQQSSGGIGVGDVVKTGLAIASMFSDERLKENVRQVGKTNDGQSIYTYNFKGSPRTEMGLMAQEVERRHPEAVGESGGYKTVDYDEATRGSSPYADGGAVDDEPFRMPGQAAMDAWRRGVAEDMGAGTIATPYDSAPPALPREITGPAPTAGAAMSYADPGVKKTSRVSVPSVPPRTDASMDDAAWPVGPRGAPSEANASVPPPGTQGVSPYSQDAPARREPGFSDSPWAALTAAGLGMMAGTSPYAGVNIGQGGLQGMKTLDAQREAAQKDATADQAARRLAQEAKHHEDTYTRQTMGQKQAKELADRPYEELTAAQKATLEQGKYAPYGTAETAKGIRPVIMETKTGQLLDGITRKPLEEGDVVKPKDGKGAKVEPATITRVADGIKSGRQPPSLTGLYGASADVRAKLEEDGFDLSKAQVEWDRAKKLTASVNAPRMVAYVGLNGAVDATIDRVRELSKKLDLSGIPALNKLELARYAKLNGNSPKGQLVAQYMTAVNTLKEEFANLANGGYAPTEAAWKLANEQVNGDYGVKQLGASIDEIQRLIRYRIQSVPGLSTMGPGVANRYTPGSDAKPDHGDPKKKPPPGGGNRPDVTTRFNELIGGGKSEEETYAILKEEGYN